MASHASVDTNLVLLLLQDFQFDHQTVHVPLELTSLVSKPCFIFDLPYKHKNNYT